MRSAALPFLFGVLSGALGGLMGIGGGIVLVPLLVHGLRQTQHQAQGTSLSFFIATALVAAEPYVRADSIPWSLVAVLALGAVPGVMLGASLAKRITARNLKGLFGVAMLASAARMLLAPPLASDGTVWAAPWNALLGFGVGTFAGLLGVGGGILLVPVLVLAEGLGQHAAQGVSLALIVPIGVVGALSYWKHGHAAPRLLPALFVGGALGGWIGATGAHALRGPTLTRLFAILLVVVAARMIFGRVSAAAPGAASPPGGTP
ncbi:MAG TPA: sulfite exporter TauE/SafE family protein [Acidobacteriota bacterium]|nr:sulfite exporter TauE/SafE family protein [Acidobacteriota bacterium]